MQASRREQPQPAAAVLDRTRLAPAPLPARGLETHDGQIDLEDRERRCSRHDGTAHIRRPGAPGSDAAGDSRTRVSRSEEPPGRLQTSGDSDLLAERMRSSSW